MIHRQMAGRLRAG